MLLCVPPFIPFRCWPLWPPNGSTVYGSTVYPVLSARLCVVCVCRRPAAPPRSRAKRCSTAAQFSVLGQLHFVPRSESIAVFATQSPLPVSAHSFSFPCINACCTSGAIRAFPIFFASRRQPPSAVAERFLSIVLSEAHIWESQSFPFLRFYLKYTFVSLLSGQGRRHSSVGRKEAEGGRCAGGPQ